MGDEHPDYLVDRWFLALVHFSYSQALQELEQRVRGTEAPAVGVDAQRLRAAWAGMHGLTVLGGGFIGLEVAATARALGKAVRVLESGPRLLPRTVSAQVSAHVEAVHRASGIDLRTGVAVGGFEVDGERLVALHAGGERLEVQALLLGIGAVPEHTLASAAGLDCDNGIAVDENMRTSDPAVLAIGDCTSFPEPTTG